MTDVIQGIHPTLGTMFAAVDPAARYVTPTVGPIKFAALLAPFASTEDAKAALVEAGAVLKEGGAK